MHNLHEVSPKGELALLQRGYLRASRRGLDAARPLPRLVYHPHLRDQPLVPGLVAQAPEPACGALPLQPCRAAPSGGSP